MVKQRLHVVWFKRDLRVSDHEPLARAIDAARSDGSAVLALYLVEPAVVRGADFSGRHYGFVRGSLLELRDALRRMGGDLIVRVSDAPDAFALLVRKYDLRGIYSHEETGNAITYARDIAVGRLLREAGVPWHEFAQTGVIRRLKDRTGWARLWEARMARQEIETPTAGNFATGLHPGDIPTHSELKLDADVLVDGQHPGEQAAHQTLASFLSERGRRYHAEISSPLTAERSCSRLSTYLAYGNISMKQVMQRTRAVIAGSNDGQQRRALRAFDARMHWHCHFMQKLESEPRVEFENFMRKLDGLREGEFRPERFEAWKSGRTGYPMVDAAMRMLAATGWINFRMRAMVMSFAAYDLWLHWREPALHLARVFTDYEPGIHYSQCQMQSGTTGINTIRTYSPTKQQIDHDPQGVFVRKWVPELARLPLGCLFEPWKAPMQAQREAGCIMGKDYPLPIVDHKLAVAEARQKIHALRQSIGARREADDIQARHGSRKSGLKQVGRRPTARQVKQRNQRAAHEPNLFGHSNPLGP